MVSNNHTFRASEGSRQLRILWVKMGALWPLDTGGRLRSFHILTELARRHCVTVMTTYGNGEDPAELERHLPTGTQFVSVPYTIPKRNSFRFLWYLLRSWFGALPVDLEKFRVPTLANRIRQAVSAGEVDVCIVDFMSATPNIEVWDSVPVIFFAHNVEYQIWRRLSRVKGGLLRPLLEIEWRKMRRCEAKACKRAALTLAVSDTDGKRLASLAPTARLATIPTGVDIDYFKPAGSARETPVSMVFSGSMDWHPNEDAVLFFIDEILPQVRRELPEASLVVVGRNPSHHLQAKAQQADVHVTGTVADIRPYVAAAALYIVPLRIGGGTRLKIFEALAMGKAVLSTTIGAEGLPLIPGKHLTLADAPNDFAQAVVALLKDPARRRGLGSNGRHLVETRYAWAQIGREFEHRCIEVLAGEFSSADKRPVPADLRFDEEMST